MTEYWDIYTKDRQLTGQKMIRGQPFQKALVTWLYMSAFLMSKVKC